MSYDAECYCADLDESEQCVFCEMETNGRLDNLTSSLRWVGAIQLGVNLGMQIGQRDSHDEWFAEHLDHVVGPVWRPGTNRPAPGWEGK